MNQFSTYIIIKILQIQQFQECVLHVFNGELFFRRKICTCCSENQGENTPHAQNLSRYLHLDLQHLQIEILRIFFQPFSSLGQHLTGFCGSKLMRFIDSRQSEHQSITGQLSIRHSIRQYKLGNWDTQKQCLVQDHSIHITYSAYSSARI